MPKYNVTNNVFDTVKQCVVKDVTELRFIVASMAMQQAEQQIHLSSYREHLSLDNYVYKIEYDFTSVGGWSYGFTAELIEDV